MGKEEKVVEMNKYVDNNAKRFADVKGKGLGIVRETGDLIEGQPRQGMKLISPSVDYTSAGQGAQVDSNVLAKVIDARMPKIEDTVRKTGMAPQGQGSAMGKEGTVQRKRGRPRKTTLTETSANPDIRKVEETPVI